MSGYVDETRFEEGESHVASDQMSETHAISQAPGRSKPVGQTRTQKSNGIEIRLLNTLENLRFSRKDELEPDQVVLNQDCMFVMDNFDPEVLGVF